MQYHTMDMCILMLYVCIVFYVTLTNTVSLEHEERLQFLFIFCPSPPLIMIIPLPSFSMQSSFGSQSPSEDTDTPCSPGLVRTYSYDKAVFDFRRIPPEKIAVSVRDCAELNTIIIGFFFC